MKMLIFIVLALILGGCGGSNRDINRTLPAQLPVLGDGTNILVNDSTEIDIIDDHTIIIECNGTCGDITINGRLIK